MREELASVVFQRTVRATETLRNAPGNVPVKLRTLLLAIDGRSSVDQYLPFLPELAPLSPKLMQLERMGLLQRREQDAVRSRCNSLHAVKCSVPRLAPSGEDASEGRRVDEPAAPEKRIDPTAAFSVPSALRDFTDQLEQLERAMSLSAARSELPGGAPSLTPVAHRLTLRSILLEMERFVARLKGLDGLALALSFEQIRSVQQLRDELPDYAVLLAPYGAPAQRHLAHVRRMLDRLAV